MEFEQSGARCQHQNKSLGISQDLHRIRNPDSDTPRGAVRRNRPVIVHIYSPKVIQTDPGNFMWVVQSLTGSSDTRSRCRKRKPLPAASDEASDLTAVAQNDKSHSDTSDGSTDCSEKPPIAQPSVERISSSSRKKCRATQRSSVGEAVATADCSSKYLVSPRGPLPAVHETVFSIPPAPAFDSSYFNLNYQVPQPSVLSSLHLPNILNPDALNESSINLNCSVWNRDRYVSPFKGSRSGIHNLLSQCLFQQTPTWDDWMKEQLVSSCDEVLYNLGEACIAETVLTRPTTY